VTASVAVTAPNFTGAFLPENAPTSYYVIGGMFLTLNTIVGAGWRISRYVAVGANFSYNYMYAAKKQKMSTIHALTPPGQEPDDFTLVAQDWLGDIRFKYAGADHGMGWAMSVLLTPAKWVGIGITYMGATPAQVTGDVSYTALGEQAQYDPELLTQLLRGAGYKLPKRMMVEIPIPPALMFGVMFKISWFMEVGADLRLWFYNMYQWQKLKPLYDPDEPGEPAITEAGLSQRTHFRLSYQFAFGVMFRPVRAYRNLEFMAGTAYDKSPYPDRTFMLDSPSLDHVKVTSGVRWRINIQWRLAFSYQLNLFLERDVRESITNPPTIMRASGHSHSPCLEMTYRF
jgi:long-subunit fatty acid transport protein